MTSKNDITGDSLQSKINSDAYRDNYDRIFGKKSKNDLPTAYDGKSDSDSPDHMDDTKCGD